MTLTARGLCKSYGGQPVLKDVSLGVDKGEFLAVVGRSGCGKTTLMRMLGGFLAPDAGEVLVDGRRVASPDKDRLMIFQSFDQLFPWLTLEGNIRFALKKTRPELSGSDARSLADQCLREMELKGAGGKYPGQLSGGMKQRGVMARALAISPKALLMDEPFSSLDPYSRENARQALLTLKRLSGAAVVFVTHDIGEAAALAQRIALMTSKRRGIARIMENKGPETVEELKCLIMEPPGIG